MCDAMLQEMQLRLAEWANNPIDTIYFGGGTPSLLTPNQLSKFLESIARNGIVSPSCEITLEVNPDDVDPENLSQWKSIGVNRLSIGIQSLSESDLRLMNRSHSSAQAKQCVKLAQDHGFSNISCDIIYGIPNSGIPQLDENLRFMIESKVPHFSAYHLTIESGTVFGTWKKKGKLHEVEDTESKIQYDFLVSMIEGSSELRQYEVSNFAIPGLESKHNTAYWKGAHYVGIGPSAHSYDGIKRKWNISNNLLYIQKIETNESWFEEETLTLADMLNELVMTRLRTVRGLDLSFYDDLAKRKLTEIRRTEIDHWITSRMLENKDNQLRLTGQGMLFADRIAADLFVFEEELK
jgi:oxygen-independent coproporphyrinogen-3 oxidase